MTSHTTQAILRALYNAVVDKPSFGVVFQIAGSYSLTEELMQDKDKRSSQLAEPMRFACSLPEAETFAILSLVANSPDSIQAFYDDMSEDELTALAVLFLWKGYRTTYRS